MPGVSEEGRGEGGIQVRRLGLALLRGPSCPRWGDRRTLQMPSQGVPGSAAKVRSQSPTLAPGLDLLKPETELWGLGLSSEQI